MQPSPYQSAILQAVRTRTQAKGKKKGLTVEALAGCGKSTILWMVAQELQQQGFKPSEVVALVFGKKNQLDLERKFGQKVGQDWGSSVRTIHSLCYEIYRDALGLRRERIKVQNSKYRIIAQDFGLLPVERVGNNIPGSLLQDEAIFTEKDFTDLLEKLRLYCLEPTLDNVAFLAELYKLGIKNLIQVQSAAATVIAKGLKDALGGCIDATDMVWVPWHMREDARFRSAIARKREQLRVVMLDECQDTDLLQIEVLSLIIDPAKSFLVAVGDQHQAVYFFRGCLSDGLKRITERFNGENLPLPVCYRCGTEHLSFVRELFPKIPIQPRPEAPAGEIRVIWQKDFLSIFANQKLSYMGVSRLNAPLTVAAIRLLADGKPAVIKDKSIGSRIVSRVRDICQKQRYNPNTFPEMVAQYEIVQKQRLAKFPDGESKIIDLQDTLEAIWALFHAYEPPTLKAWEDCVDRIFKDSDYQSPISLYSIHSGKGGEGEIAFLLAPDRLPLNHPKQTKEEELQEYNLLYVALTRCLATDHEGSGILYIVIRDDDGKPKYPGWLPERYRTLKKADEEQQPGVDEDEEEEEDEQLFAKQSIFASDYNDPEDYEHDLEIALAKARAEDEEAEEPQQPSISIATLAPEPETNNCASALPTSLDLAELEEQIRKGFSLSRDFYHCGKALMLVRDNELYKQNFATFEEYCEKRFEKSLRLAQYFMSAASVTDNLLEAGCSIVPTAESQVRAIAALPVPQQIAIWQKACEESDGKAPIAAKVKRVRADLLGESIPTKKNLPSASTLLEKIRQRLGKKCKISLHEIEIILELIEEDKA